MLFQTFLSQEERRGFGGSYFMEMQYCSLPRGTGIEKIVSVEAVTHWKNDSLYICGDDENAFVSLYGGIFAGGTYSNLKRGAVDTCGVNYYSPEQAKRILERVRENEPLKDPILLSWLQRAQSYNGFYLLGL